ncbi:hypothetical protein QCA50_020259 [Cerrena zonata]|uniref:XPG N-terminal domain-containing protein n=1 Tax=Cerrena zonata TaxID=2478898 RepID=A0AAW0F9U1_9APHY
MGVIGLIPFLKKACSDVIQTIPNRFVDLRGKRVVLDGTLLTQRLHFAPTPHAHRHVLGWYRIIKELQASEVKAVCVFDGPQRSLAKQLEIERRRRIRRLTESRGVFESNRFRRLRRLNTLLHSWETLDPVTRDRTLDNLRHLAANAEEQPTLPTHAASDLEDIDVLLDRLTSNV